MEVEVSLGQLQLISDVLRKLVSIEMPVKKAWKIRELLILTYDKLRGFEEEKRKLIIKYNLGPNGEVPDDKKEEFQKEATELLSIKVKINLDDFLSLDDLEGLNLSPRDLDILSPYIKVEKEEKK